MREKHWENQSGHDGIRMIFLVSRVRLRSALSRNTIISIQSKRGKSRFTPRDSHAQETRQEMVRRVLKTSNMPASLGMEIKENPEKDDECTGQSRVNRMA